MGSIPKSHIEKGHKPNGHSCNPSAGEVEVGEFLVLGEHLILSHVLVSGSERVFVSKTNLESENRRLLTSTPVLNTHTFINTKMQVAHHTHTHFKLSCSHGFSVERYVSFHFHVILFKSRFTSQHFTNPLLTIFLSLSLSPSSLLFRGFQLVGPLKPLDNTAIFIIIYGNIKVTVME